MRFADFCSLVQKGAVVTLVITGVTEPIFIKFVQYVATVFPAIECFNQNDDISIRFGMSLYQMSESTQVLP